MSTPLSQEISASPFPPLAPPVSTPQLMQRTEFDKGVKAELRALAERRRMPREDHELLAACSRELRDALNVPKGRIAATVINGTVVLDGHTSYYYQRAAAECAVRFIDGVRRVENHIKVVPPGLALDVRDLIVND